ncbi:hypothetical protein ACFVJ3_15215 [Rhodococcus sp. NPDC127593]|uniref:hypothetical protein n=1 Tax=Rhodococcus sp. NPDC127593 TaxID=3345404 RepID=UPI00363E82AB
MFAQIRPDRATTPGASPVTAGLLRWRRPQEHHPGAGERLETTFIEVRKTVLELPQLSISSPDGPTMGVGATLALLCAVVFASDRAQVGDPHPRAGPARDGIVIWPWLIGINRAKQHLMTDDKM